MVRKLSAIGLFIGAVIAAQIVWHFAWKGFSAHHADSPAVQGLAAVLD